MRISEGFKDISHPDAPGFVDINVEDFPEDVVRDLLRLDDGVDDSRSQTVAIRFPNGDLVIGFYPQGDTYELVSQFYLGV